MRVGQAKEDTTKIKKKIFSMVDGNQKILTNGFLEPISLRMKKAAWKKVGLLGELRSNT